MLRVSKRRTLLVAVFLFASVVLGAHAQQGGAAPALAYDAQTRGPVPIPPSERGLQAVVAEPWFKVSDAGLVLEGPAFDRDGNLLFCDVSGRRVLRLTPDRRLSTVVTLDQLSPGGLAVHKDGRIFIAAMNLDKGIGSILAVQPDGSGMRAIIPPEAGYMPNDLVFDTQGGPVLHRLPGRLHRPEGRRVLRPA
jgi:lactonase